MYAKTVEASTGKLWVVNQADGSVLSKVDTVSSGSGVAPAVFGTDVYMADGVSSGVSKFGGGPFARLWHRTSSDAAAWQPSVDASAYYVVSAGVLHAGSTDTGASIYSINSKNSETFFGVAPALSDKQLAFASVMGKLLAFDLAGRKVAWTSAEFAGAQPAYAKGVAYTLGGAGSGELHAYAADTGTNLWKSSRFADADGSIGGGEKRQIVITDNLAFVSTGLNTVAIDLDTRKQVWMHPESGDLSISQNGVLYILPRDGTIHAINLKP